MYNFFRYNKNILLVASSVFMVSMTSLLLFLNTENGGSQEMKADVVGTGSVQSEEVETKYRTLFNNQEDPVVVLGLDGNISFASWNFESETGFANEKLTSSPLFSYLHPEDLPTFFAAFGKVVATGKPVTMIGPFRLRDSKGQYHFNMGSVYPVIEDGKVKSIGITTHDITDNLDQYIKPEETIDAAAAEDAVEPVTETAADDALQTDVRSDPEGSAPVRKINKTIRQKNSVEETDKEDGQKVKWEKPRKYHNDPAWITGGKLVMLTMPW